MNLANYPKPPTPPPSRVEYNVFLNVFVGPEDEFKKWKAEPFWRRALGLTEWDRRK